MHFDSSAVLVFMRLYAFNLAWLFALRLFSNTLLNKRSALTQNAFIPLYLTQVHRHIWT